jgi:hypothetical protein
MGNLPSSLLRLSQSVQMRHNDGAIVDLMREIAWLIEWNGELLIIRNSPSRCLIHQKVDRTVMQKYSNLIIKIHNPPYFLLRLI